MKVIKTNKHRIEILVDDDNYKYLANFKWYVGTHGYAVRTNKTGKKILLHREVMEAKGKEQVEHKDGNKLNCQKSNLRFSTQQQNQMNKKGWSKSGYKGVYWHKLGSGWWRAIITIADKPKHLGLFKNKKEAAIAYDNAAKKYFGEFAKFNFPSLRRVLL